MKHLIILNGMAGSEKAGSFKEKIIEEMKGLDYELHLTTAPKEATKFIREYLKENKEETVRVYACGGDGTVFECANGIVGANNAELAIYPIGSGNDFVKCYGDKERFLNMKKLSEAESKPVDLTKISGPTLEEPLYSINVINFGFDAIVGAVGNKNKEKGLDDPYGKALKVAIFKGRFNKTVVTADGEKLNKKKLLLCTIAQGKYVGGKFCCAPKSVNDDGLLDVCLLRTRPLLAFLGIWKPYTNGEHLDNEKYRKTLEYRQVKKVEIDAPKDIDVCIDGEMIVGSHFDVEIIPQAIKLVIPE